MQSWDELLHQSLLGTARANEALPALPASLAGLMGEGAAPEEQLLTAATLVDRYRRLGTLPAPCAEAPAQAPAETLPAGGEALETLLRSLLEDEDPKLLAELLAGMAALPCRVPADTLPDLLYLAADRKLKLAQLQVVGGERLRWLVAQHPRWLKLQWPTAPGSTADEEPWLSSDLGTRGAFLRDERGRDPEAARARLAEGFAQEPARERQALLECLEVGLGAADTAFLASCLEDRSQGVRQQAVVFLLRLGDNATATLVADMAAGMVSTEGLLRKKLQVKLPDAFDKDWTRLGLREKPPAGQRIGQRAFWMLQWLELLGPSRLAALLEVDLDTLSGLIKRSDFARELKQSMAQAAETLRDAGYAEWRLAGAGPKEFPNFFAALGPSLSLARREALLASFLEQHLEKLDPERLRVLLEGVGIVSVNTTRTVAAHFEALCKSLDKHHWSARSFPELAYYLSPTEAPTFKVLCQAHGGSDGVNEFWRRYERRCRIHQALQGSSP